jgi:hypothetical protein
MKKYLLGVVAIAMAISLSAFTAPKRMPVKNKKGTWDLWWFKIKPGYGGGSLFQNEMVEFITISPYMPEYICTTFPWLYKCTIGFEVSEIEEGTNDLRWGWREPVASGEMRPTM